MFYYAINKASNSLKLPPVKKLDLTKFVISIFMKICSIFIKIESYEASRKLVYNFLADARKTTDKLGFCLIFFTGKENFSCLYSL